MSVSSPGPVRPRIYQSQTDFDTKFGLGNVHFALFSLLSRSESVNRDRTKNIFQCGSMSTKVWRFIYVNILHDHFNCFQSKSHEIIRSIHFLWITKTFSMDLRYNERFFHRERLVVSASKLYFDQIFFKLSTYWIW